MTTAIGKVWGDLSPRTSVRNRSIGFAAFFSSPFRNRQCTKLSSFLSYREKIKTSSLHFVSKWGRRRLEVDPFFFGFSFRSDGKVEYLSKWRRRKWRRRLRILLRWFQRVGGTKEDIRKKNDDESLTTPNQSHLICLVNSSSVFIDLDWPEYWEDHHRWLTNWPSRNIDLSLSPFISFLPRGRSQAVQKCNLTSE